MFEASFYLSDESDILRPDKFLQLREISPYVPEGVKSGRLIFYCCSLFSNEENFLEFTRMRDKRVSSYIFYLRIDQTLCRYFLNVCKLIHSNANMLEDCGYFD